MSTARRRRFRRSLTLALFALGGLTVGLMLFGERLTSSLKVSDGTGPVSEAAYRAASRFHWQQIGGITADDSFHETEPAFDPQSKALYFARQQSGTGWDLFCGDLVNNRLTDVSALFELNSAEDDSDPAFTDGGATLLFASNRPGGKGGFDLYLCERSRTGWSAPRPLSDANSVHDDREPTLDASGSRLVFASNRLAEDAVRYDLFECHRTETGWSDPVLLLPFGDDATSEQRSPELSADGRFLYFTSDAPRSPHPAIPEQSRKTPCARALSDRPAPSDPA